jgi:acyl-CoA synthetase (AMP-forming)/AMP-acid ligase II
VEVLAGHLAAHGLRRQAWPERVEVVSALPRTVAGKVDKAELARRFFPRSPGGGGNGAGVTSDQMVGRAPHPPS